MGYDVRITRTDELAEVVEETPILPEEFFAAIAGMPIFVVDSGAWYARRGDDGAEVRIQGVAVGEPGANANYLFADDGVITAKHPSAETLRWMVIVARRLDAYVRGDDGEEYDLDENGVVLVDGKPYPIPADERTLRPRASEDAVKGWISELQWTNPKLATRAPRPTVNAAQALPVPATRWRVGEVALLVALALIAAWLML